MMVEEKATKLIVLGNRGVGKTAIIVRCITRRFLPEYASDSDVLYSYKTHVDNKSVEMHIVDSNDELSYEPDGTDGLIVVCSITSRKSFIAAQEIIKNVHAINNTDVPITLVANKKDLFHKRKVSRRECLDYAKKENVKFFEVSAAQDIEIIMWIFHDIYRTIQIRKGVPNDKKRKASNAASPSSLENRKKLFGTIQDLFRKRPSV